MRWEPMKIGIVVKLENNSFGRYGASKFAKVRQCGYDAADINLSNTESGYYLLDDFTLNNILQEDLREAKESNVWISQVHGPWRYPPRDATVEDRAERMEKMKQCVQITANLGCKHMVVHPIMPFGTQDLGTEFEAETWRLNLAYFKELLEFARAYGVIICLENMPMRKFSIAKPERILQLVKEMDDEYLGICLDTGHVSIFPELHCGDEIRRLGSHLKVVHIHDNHGDKDAHLCPMEGRLDWNDIVDALHQVGFNGAFSLEIKAFEHMDDTQFAAANEELCRAIRVLTAGIEEE